MFSSVKSALKSIATLTLRNSFLHRAVRIVNLDFCCSRVQYPHQCPPQNLLQCPLHLLLQSPLHHQPRPLIQHQVRPLIQHQHQLRPLIQHQHRFRPLIQHQHQHRPLIQHQHQHQHRPLIQHQHRPRIQLQQRPLIQHQLLHRIQRRFPLQHLQLTTKVTSQRKANKRSTRTIRGKIMTRRNAKEEEIESPKSSPVITVQRIL